MQTLLAQVDVSPRECDKLGDTQPRLGKHPDEQLPSLRRLVEQSGVLLGRQRPSRVALIGVGSASRQANADARIRADQAILDGGRQKRTERRDG